MDRNSNEFTGRSLIVCASIAIAIFASTAAHAQRIPIAVENATGAAAAKAMTVISKPGSYLLSRNLTVTRAGIDGVLITSPNVTLNLQGFTVSGNSSANNGINATGQNNVVIVDGIVTGFGGTAVIAGDAANISALTVTANGSGINCSIGSLVQGNIIHANTGEGLTFSDTTGGYLGNVLQGNGGSTSPGATGQVTGGISLGHNLCNGAAC
jgi:hypothetical protein